MKDEVRNWERDRMREHRVGVKVRDEMRDRDGVREVRVGDRVRDGLRDVTEVKLMKKK